MYYYLYNLIGLLFIAFIIAVIIVHCCLTADSTCGAVLGLQVVVFMYYGFQLDRWVLQVSSPSYLKGPLPYHPQLRSQAWRYLSYAFMHTG